MEVEGGKGRGRWLVGVHWLQLGKQRAGVLQLGEERELRGCGHVHWAGAEHESLGGKKMQHRKRGREERMLEKDWLAELGHCGMSPIFTIYYSRGIMLCAAMALMQFT